MDNSNNVTDQQRVFSSYIEAFSDKDFAAVASHFSLPALLVSPGEPISIDSNEKLVGLMQALRANLPEGYDHTSLQKFTLFEFSESSAAAQVIYDRCTEDNTVLSTEHGVYYFCKVEDQWKIYSVALLPKAE